MFWHWIISEKDGVIEEGSQGKKVSSSNNLGLNTRESSDPGVQKWRPSPWRLFALFPLCHHIQAS